MKNTLLLIQITALLALAQQPASADTNFVLNPNPAMQASFPTRESYEYQILSTTDYSRWSPASERQVATGSTQTVTLNMNGAPRAFYRAQEFLPDLTRRIVGLTNIFFDNAVFSGQGPALTVSGFRAISRDYTLNDYLKAQFQFDLRRQTFSFSNLQVFANVGLVCGQSPAFFIKDVTNDVTMLNGASVLSPDTTCSITTTGQTLTVNLRAAQVFSMVITSLSADNRFIVKDPNGAVVSSDTFTPGSTWFTDPVEALVPGAYTVRFIPQAVSSSSVRFLFHNCNNHQTRVLTNGTYFSTSIGKYRYDYDKSAVNLQAGQTLQLAAPGSGAYLEVFNSRGVQVYRRGGTGSAIFLAPSADTYYIIYSHDDLTAHSYGTSVSITP